MGGLLMTAPDASLLAERIESIQRDMAEMKGSMASMASMATALNKLAIVEERQSTAAQSLERAFGEIAKSKADRDLLWERIRTLESVSIESKGRNIWVDRALTGVVMLAGWLLAKAMGLIK